MTHRSDVTRGVLGQLELLELVVLVFVGPRIERAHRRVHLGLELQEHLDAVEGLVDSGTVLTVHGA